MNVYVGQNTKKVEEFIEHIRERIIAAAHNWKEIAAAFGEAKEMYGFESDTFKRLCIATKFSKSKASKLATIATSERLKMYEKSLSAVQSWTVMYAIATMKENEFQELMKIGKIGVDTHDKSEIISMGMISQARNAKRETTTLRAYATVYVEIDALRGQAMNGQNIADIEEHLRAIQTTVPYVKVVKSYIEQKEDSAYFAALQREKQTAERKAFDAAMKRKLKNDFRAEWETQKDFEMRVLGDTRDNMREIFIHDAKEAFTLISEEYDESVFHEEAQNIVNEKARKLEQRLVARGDAFMHANSAIIEMKREADAQLAFHEKSKKIAEARTEKYRKHAKAFEQFR